MKYITPIWRKILVVTLILGIGVCLYFLSRSQTQALVVTPTAEGTSKTEELCGLRFPHTAVDLGSVREATKHTFFMENATQQQVVIQDVRVSCSCLTVLSAPKAIEPGEKAALEVFVDPKQLPLGRHIKSVHLMTSATEERGVRLELRFHNLPDIVLPENVTVRMVVDQPGAHEIELVDYRATPINITSVTASDPGTTVTVIEKPQSYLPGWKYRMKVSVSPNSKPGNYVSTVNIRTDDANNSTLSIPIEIRVSPRLSVSPTRIFFSSDKGENAAKIFVRDILGEPVTIEAVNSPLSCILGKIEQSSTPGSGIVTLKYSPTGKEPESRRVLVRLIATTPVREELCVEVHFPGP